MTVARNTTIRSATVEHPLQSGFARFSRLLIAEFVLELCQLLMEVREADSDLWFRIARVLSQIFRSVIIFRNLRKICYFKSMKLHIGSKFLADQTQIERCSRRIQIGTNSSSGSVYNTSHLHNRSVPPKKSSVIDISTSR